MKALRMIAAVLSAALLIQSAPLPCPVTAVSAEAAASVSAASVVDSGLCGNQLKWWLESDGTLTISGNDSMSFTSSPWSRYSKDDITKIVIDKDVKSIQANAFSYFSALTRVQINSTVLTEIPTGAFQNCGKMTAITIPKQVTSVGSSAFKNCGSLSAVTLPDGVTSIGQDAFFGCSALKSITIPESVTQIGPNAFYEAGCCTVYDGVEYAGNWAVGLFMEHETLDNGTVVTHDPVVPESCTIRSGTQGICSWLFRDQLSLKQIALPDSLRYINANAFSGSGLTSLTLPSGLRTVENQAFKFCISLTSMKIAEGVEYLGDEAFSNCNRLTSVTLPKSLKELGTSVFFDCTALKTITAYCYDIKVPSKNADTILGFSSKTEIERTVKCYSLFTWLRTYAKDREGYTLEIMELGNERWTVDNWILKIHDPAGMTPEEIDELRPYIVNIEFDRPDYLQEPDWEPHETADGRTIYIAPGGAIDIPAGFFHDMPVLRAVVLSERVASVGAGAFAGCGKLETVDFRNPETVIDSAEDTIPCGTLCGYAGSTASEYVSKHSDLKFSSVFSTDKSASNYFGFCGENVRYRYTDYTYAGKSDFGTLYIYGSGEMQDYSSAKEQPWSNLHEIIVVSGGVTSIGRYAFAGLKQLRTVTLPEGLRSIGDYAFESSFSPGMTLTVPKGAVSIGAHAFDGCRLNKIKLPDTLVTIGDYAFYENVLDELIIPGSVKSFGSNSFGRCADKLFIYSLDCVIPDEWYYSSTSWYRGDTEEHRYTTLYAYNRSSLYFAGYTFHSLGDPYGYEPTPAEFTADGYTAVLDSDGVLTVTAEGALPDYPDLQSSPYCADSRIKKVVFSEGITRIGDRLFYDCDNIMEVVLPESLREIGEMVLAKCGKLKKIYIPRGTELCAENALSGTIYIYRDSPLFDQMWEHHTVVTLEPPETETETTTTTTTTETTTTTTTTETTTTTATTTTTTTTATTTTTTTTTETTTTTTTTEDRRPKAVFDPETKTLTVSGEGSMEEIYGLYNGFSRHDVVNVVIADGITDILPNAFNDCANLVSVQIGRDVGEIGYSAFKCCTSLAEITLPDRVRTIGEQAFYGCEALKTVRFGKSLESITRQAFFHAGLTAADIPASVREIGDDAFYECRSLSELTLHEGLETIGVRAFYATALTEAVIPESVTALGREVFWDCKEMTAVRIGAGVTEIPERLVYGCKSLTSLICAGEIGEVGNLAFGATALTSVQGIPDTALQAYAEMQGLAFTPLSDERKPGDFNGNGVITAADAALLAKLVGEDPALTEAQLDLILRAWPDVNCDGLVTVADVTVFCRFLEPA